MMRSVAASIAGAAAIAGAAWAVRGRSSAVFGPSIWRGPRDRRALALTFDDGPSESTPAILDVLARHGVSATFFQCGANVERLPAIARAVARRRARNRQSLATRTRSSAFARRNSCCSELERAQRAIEANTGARPDLVPRPLRRPLARPRRRAAALGLTGVMWTVIGYDWNLTAEAVVRRVSGRVSNGAIVCLHDGRELRAKPDIRTTIDAVGAADSRCCSIGDINSKR